MNTITRKKNKVTAGDISVTIPSDKSMLSILGNNSFINGTTFAKDGYIYKGKKKLKKYFISREGWNHFWEPTLSQISRIEAAYQKASKRHTKRWKNLFKIVHKIVQSGHAIERYGETRYIAHAFCETQKAWMAYACNNENYSFDWLDKKPKKVVNRKLGEQLNKMDRQLMKAGFRYKLEKLLDDAIVNMLWQSNKEMTKEPLRSNSLGAIFEVNINNQKYFYTFAPSRHGMWWQKLAWPGDNYKVVNV